MEKTKRAFIAGLLSVAAAGYSDVSLGLVGGQLETNDAYAAFLSNPSGAPSSISALPSNGQILSVGMNASGIGLIGGQNLASSDPYAAFVLADGTLIPLTFPSENGSINSVAINTTALGLVGGALNTGYAAQVFTDGTVHSLTFSADGINAVALNDAGVGLIGGEGSTVAYAAYVDAGGNVTQITGASMPDGVSDISAVAINSLGNGIIGGTYTDQSAAFAAFVSPGGGDPTALTSLPAGFGASILSVAINTAGVGLVGGTDASSNAYAGYVAADATVTTLFNSPFLGAIYGVALNTSGVGIIGGDQNSNLYAAFVYSNATVKSLLSDPPPGTINAVAINDAGLGLIGGQATTAYLALIAPSGALTELDIANGSDIYSVALQTSILAQATPTSIGPYGSSTYMQLAAATALNTRLIQQNRIWSRPRGSNNSEVAWNLALSPKQAAAPIGTTSSNKANSFWLEPFGDFVHLQEGGAMPSLTNEVAGALLGYDRQGDHFLAGATLGYAFNYVHYAQNVGHAKVQEEMISVYGVYYADHFWCAAALWGGLYQSTNIRHTLSQITSTGKTHGYLLQPHFELADPWAMDSQERYYIEPFLQLDWVNNWQHHYTESGSSGLNVQMPGFYNSLLQSEIGFRFYERFAFGWGDFCLEEKVSYVNQAPFNVHSVNTAFVSSSSTFPVAVGSSNVQNLGSVQLLGCFEPCNSAYPYGGFSLQATAGSAYQSYFASLFVGVDF